MARVVSEQEVKAVAALPADKRYSYFIKKVADQRELWGLSTEEGWDLLGDDRGNEYFPLWPFPQFAELYAADGWTNHDPSRIGVTDWLDGWTPKMIADGKSVAVFPTPTDPGLTVALEMLHDDLLAELELYEFDE